MTAEPTFSRLTKTGQPVMGSTIVMDTVDGGRMEVRVVGKLWGAGGASNLIGIVIEETDRPGSRTTLEWPLVRESA